jgi:hypothetical protein
MRNGRFTLSYGGMLMLGMAVPDVAQDDGGQQPSALEQLQQIHTPRSIDQEFAHLTKDLTGFRRCSTRIRTLAAGACASDSRYQRRKAPRNSCSAD